MIKKTVNEFMKSLYRLRIWMLGLFACTFLFAFHGSLGAEVEHSIKIAPTLDVNRTLGTEFLTAVSYDLLLPIGLWTRIGLLSESGALPDIAYTVALGYRPGFLPGLSVECKLLVNSYPESMKSIHSLIPALTYDWKSFEFELGINFRRLNPDADKIYHPYPVAGSISETLLSYRIAYSYPFWIENSGGWVEFNNRELFYAGNNGGYGLFSGVYYKLEPGWKFSFMLGFRPAGSIALTANFYRIILGLSAELAL